MGNPVIYLFMMNAVNNLAFTRVVIIISNDDYG